MYIHLRCETYRFCRDGRAYANGFRDYDDEKKSMYLFKFKHSKAAEDDLCCVMRSANHVPDLLSLMKMVLWFGVLHLLK